MLWLPLLFYKTLSSVSFSDSAAPLGLPTGFLYNPTARENSRHFLKLGGGDGSRYKYRFAWFKTSCGCTSKRHTGTLRQNEFCPEVPGAPFQKCCALFWIWQMPSKTNPSPPQTVSKVPASRVVRIHKNPGKNGRTLNVRKRKSAEVYRRSIEFFVEVW